MSLTEPTLTICRFSRVYEDQPALLKKADCIMDFSDLPGTSCYCDEEAAEMIRRRIAELPDGGIRLIDSGNYHYMSAIWMSRQTEPFDLMVFDNHTDMQEPAFGSILSCGGWIAWALDAQPSLRRVFLAGPPAEDFRILPARLRERTVFLSKEALTEERGSEALSFFDALEPAFPLYLSIDKDILCEQDALTGWTQGELSLNALLLHLDILKETLHRDRIPLVGLDICGEAPENQPDIFGKNETANRALISYTERLGEHMI